jgi:phage-related protein
LNLFELFVKIGVDDKASTQIANISQKLGNGLRVAAKVGTAAVAAAASGITALTTSAIKNYAEYEQLVGGVETLFKDNADAVQRYALEAYKTAGLSANEYMSTVTSFSASLLQSLDGDTEKAAEYADRAIRDMSDNANKMGTDISMIQNAYQGFAKQNYTMLDNLKLGYGGTKTEMARLVKEAAALKEIQEELGIVVNENDASFGNIVNAISVVQKSMDIMGTTSEEAASTIQGSISSMKSAWENLVVGIADEKADADALINNFVESVFTVSGNLTPRIKIALGGVRKLISYFGGMIKKNAKSIAQYGVDFLNSFIIGITDNINNLDGSAEEIVDGVAEFIEDNLPTLVDSAVGMVSAIGNGIAKNAKVITPKAVELITFVAKEISNPETLVPLADSAIDIMSALGEGLIDSLPHLIDSLPQIIDGLAESVSKTNDKIVDAGVELMGSLLSDTPAILESIGENLPDLAKGLYDLILESIPLYGVGKRLIEGLFEGMSDGVQENNFAKPMKGITNKIKDFFGIKSPSRLFRDEIGKMLARGIGVGFDDEMGNLQRLIDDDLSELNNDIESNMSYGSFSGAGSVVGSTTISGVEINIYADQVGDSAESIADAVAVALQDLVDRRSAVYG